MLWSFLKIVLTNSLRLCMEDLVKDSIKMMRQREGLCFLSRHATREKKSRNATPKSICLWKRHSIGLPYLKYGENTLPLIDSYGSSVLISMFSFFLNYVLSLKQIFSYKSHYYWIPYGWQKVILFSRRTPVRVKKS